MENIDITPDELASIRKLGNFDLTMLLSDIHDCGWPSARKTLVCITEAVRLLAASGQRFDENGDVQSMDS